MSVTHPIVIGWTSHPPSSLRGPTCLTPSHPAFFFPAFGVYASYSGIRLSPSIMDQLWPCNWVLCSATSATSNRECRIGKIGDENPFLVLELDIYSSPTPHRLHDIHHNTPGQQTTLFSLQLYLFSFFLFLYFLSSLIDSNQLLSSRPLIQFFTCSTPRLSLTPKNQKCISLSLPSLLSLLPAPSLDPLPSVTKIMTTKADSREFAQA